MKRRGNACHKDLSGVMGNSWGIGVHTVTVHLDGYVFQVGPKGFKKDGTLRKSVARRLKMAATLKKAA
nr:MAG TPA: hypothetical protein [Caudoviricetes sp.]